MKKTSYEIIKMINDKTVSQLYIKAVGFPNPFKIQKAEMLNQLCSFSSTHEMDVDLSGKKLTINY